MFMRMKVLLTLLQVHGTISNLKMVKLMFLISQDSRLENPPYYFVPYIYGPFSFQLYADVSYLEREGYIVQAQKTITAQKREIFLDDKYAHIVERYVNEFRNYSHSELVSYTYSHYPAYTIFEKVLEPEYRSEHGIVTIGYEGLSVDQFLMKVISHRISCVADVRRNAFSRKVGFSRNLGQILEKFGIEYVHFPELGVPSYLRRNLNSSEDYENLLKVYEKDVESRRDMIETIFVMGSAKKVAVMCFEADVRSCHRGVIGRKLRELGAQVVDL